ncbi:coiled-coil domain-containing protein 185 [Ranitomeya imitator]|uniref:coiled-coil domain-containing protein 185 n=1 Tax=Ranitomeya imitator TaxID=111125 RepID=UPI0037E7E3B6
MEGGRRSPSLHLDLTNFEDGGDSRYVLTSPHSLEACARLGVRPVDLLYKSYGEVREEKPGASSHEVREMYEAHEMERQRKKRQCQELRKSLMESAWSQEQHVQPSTACRDPRDPATRNHKDPTTSNAQNHRDPAGQNSLNHRDPTNRNHQDPAIHSPRDQQDHSTQNHRDPTGQNPPNLRDPTIQNYQDPTIHNPWDPQDSTSQNPWNHQDPAIHSPRDQQDHSTQNHRDPTGQNPPNHRDPTIQNYQDPTIHNPWDPQDSTSQNPWNHQDPAIHSPRDQQDHSTQSHRDTRTQNRDPTTHKLWYHRDITAHKPWNHRGTTTSPDHWDYLEVKRTTSRRDPYTLASSPSQWDSYNLVTSPNRWDSYNFATSPNPATTGHRGEGDMRRSLSQGNLVYQEEQIRHLTRKVEKEVKVPVPYRDKKIAALMLLKHQEEEMSMQRKLQAQQAWDDLRSKEKVIRDALIKRDWTDRPQNHRRSPRSSKLDWQLDAVRYMTAQNNKDWKMLTPEERILLKDGMKKVQEDLQSKRRQQDIRDTGGRLLEERMLQAFKAKMIKDLQDKKNIQIKNDYEKLRHSRLKEVADNQVKAEELSKRMSMRQKERRFQDIYEQIQEERLKEIQNKASREEAMIVMAKLRAERQEKEQINHKKMLLQISNQKTRQAKDTLGKSLQSKSERMRELNIVKEKAHQILKQKVEEDEENQRTQIAHQIRIKDRKSDKLLKEKEATVQEGKKIARASFHMRDKIREQTKSRTFDQMALQAQLSASFMKSLP